MKPGDVIQGKYEILRKIGSAGFGAVYECWDLGLDRPVAIKSILPNLADEDKFIKMFMDEAVITARLSHENIVQIYELLRGIENELFIVMQLVDGKDLRQIMKQETGEKMPPDLVAYIISRTCAALRYAHESKDPRTGQDLHLVHRDVSPANVMVSYNGIVKLMDFGIAKADQRTTEVTKTGVLKGKISYMSPEQAMGHAVDGQSDLYSLGIVMFEMLTGERPFKGNNDLEILQKVAQGKIDKSPLEKAQVPHKLREIVLKALEKDKSKRYQTAQEMYLDLHSYFSSIDSVSLQNKLAKYMREKFKTEIQDREHMAPIRTESRVSDLKTAATATRPMRQTEAQTQQIPTEIGKNNLLLKFVVPAIIAFIVISAAFFGYQYIANQKPIAYVETIPHGVTVSIGDHKLGETPITIYKNTLPTGQYDMVFRYPNLDDLSVTAQYNKNDGFSIKNLLPFDVGERKKVFTVPFLAEFNFVSKPESATVYIDNENLGKTPLRVEKKLSQDMNIRVEREGFEAPEPVLVDWSNLDLPEKSGWKFQKTTFENGDSGFGITALFSKKVLITTTPEGATLFIDGANQGITPIETVLTFGEHVFRADKGKSSTGKEPIEITEKTEKIELALKNLVKFVAKTSSGREITANITVKTGRESKSGTTQEPIAIPAGSSVVTFSRNGYATKTERFNSKTDSLVTVTLQEIKPYVRVVVKNMEGKPLAGAAVMYKIGNGAYRTAGTTNSQGQITIKVESGQNYFKAEKDGKTSPEVTVLSGSSGTKEANLTIFIK